MKLSSLGSINTCAVDFAKCSQAGLPDNFCCSAGSTCNVLAGGTTVLCCPEGGDCSKIKTVSCDISLQDPGVNPTAALKTTELDGKLPVCGKGCCPFGYHCDEGSVSCVKDEDQNLKPGQTSSTTTSVPGPTSAVTPSPTTSGDALSTSTSVPAATTSATTGGAGGLPAKESETPSPAASSAPNTAAIVGGVVGALIFLSAVGAGFWLVRQRRRKAAADEKKRDATAFATVISAPIPHADYHTQRLDFLAKAQGSSASSSPTRVDTYERFPPNSPYSAFAFRPNSQMTDAPRSHHSSAEVGGLRNLTSRYSIPNPFASPRERQHSGGSESINIFADPSTVGTPSTYNRRDTTWTEFQNHADRSRASTPTPLPRR
ncbi:hypothetical protein SAMD00023353_0300440 [Rosellinia necatrix]|uniref:Uncharacterized protein n=1 Tax=Rosellinia necatrix TaxID=77044 RepID=A0A1W2TD86_ROSNE|nr:hypothetical protein SAMD00023353_0300440 [Rosellinia necatrix]